MPDVSREIAVPFRFDGDGGVAYVSSDFAVFTQRLRSIIMTALGERAMLPTYGTPVNEYLFEVNDSLAAAELAGFIQRAITKWEPGVILRGVRPTSNDPQSGVLEFEVNFSVAPRDDVHSTLVSVGGSIQDVTS